MSSLVHLPSGQTLDYWWERLRGRPQRKRFLLTKIIEVLAYSFSKRKQSLTPTINTHFPVLELKPMIKQSGITQASMGMVVIPARCLNKIHCMQLDRLVNGLVPQNAPVVVVNDGSKLWPELPAAVHQLSHSESKGPAAARNTGINHALGLGADFILMTDLDCVPSENWVSKAKEAFVGNPYAHAFSGLTESFNTTWMDRYHDLNGTLNGRRFKGTKFLLYGPTCNLAISRELAAALRFDETYTSAACEDIDFCYRALEMGFRVLHCSQMVIRHDYQYREWALIPNLAAFIRQFGKYARAEATLLGKFPNYHAHFGNTLEISSLSDPKDRMDPPDASTGVSGSMAGRIADTA